MFAKGVSYRISLAMHTQQQTDLKALANVRVKINECP